MGPEPAQVFAQVFPPPLAPPGRGFLRRRFLGRICRTVGDDRSLVSVCGVVEPPMGVVSNEISIPLPRGARLFESYRPVVHYGPPRRRIKGVRQRPRMLETTGFVNVGCERPGLGPIVGVPTL